MARRNAGVKKENTVLEDALEAVSGDRMEKYGDPADMFYRWRELCVASGRPGLANVKEEDLAIAMILPKVARETNAPNRDNYVDIAGYAEILSRVGGGQE